MQRAPFPSLVVTANELSAQGAFAEAQAAYLNPDPDTVADLRARLERALDGLLVGGLIPH